MTVTDGPVGRSPDRLYDLMPSLYRILDDDQGHVMRGLVGLVNQQADLLRDDVERLWDDFFVETCQRWVVPYLGDLIGNVPLLDPAMEPGAATAEELFTDLTGPSLAVPSPVRSRADVAHTISYRRRKGTPAMLEELARDVTGWGALVTEFFQRLGWTQHLEHLRRGAAHAPHLGDVDAARRTAGPWDRAQHHVDVRAISAHEGWFNISNLGIFVWRLMAQPRTRVTPRQAGAAWQLTFSPLGNDVPIFSAGDAAPLGTGRTREEALDTPLRPAALFADLRSLPVGPVDSSRWYGVEGAARLVIRDNGVVVPASQIGCANLDRWTAFSRPSGTRVLVDPALGRLAVPTGRNPAQLEVSFCEGFVADLGGGEYERSAWLVDNFDGPPEITVSGGGTALQTALTGRTPVDHKTVVRIVDNATYDLTGDLTLAADERLVIEAANAKRPLVRLPSGEITVRTATNDTDASLTLGGLLVEGGLRVMGDLRLLRLLHTTLVPGRSVLPGAGVTGPSLWVRPSAGVVTLNARLEVQIAASIVGALRLPEHVAGLWLLDCIVDGITADGDPKGKAICDGPGTSGPVGHLERTTVLGSVLLSQAPMISESILTHAVRVERTQKGCVRFSYVTPASETPRKYRCQPDLAIAAALDQRRRDAAADGVVLPPGWELPIVTAIGTALVPAFTAEQYGDPGYAQLHDTCPVGIATGAEDGAEMGAFCQQKNPQREANLRLRLDEYLPVGLEVGLIHQT
jgi:hypothetical protein